MCESAHEAGEELFKMPPEHQFCLGNLSRCAISLVGWYRAMQLRRAVGIVLPGGVCCQKSGLAGVSVACRGFLQGGIGKEFGIWPVACQLVSDKLDPLLVALVQVFLQLGHEGSVVSVALVDALLHGGGEGVIFRRQLWAMRFRGEEGGLPQSLHVVDKELGQRSLEFLEGSPGLLRVLLAQRRE